MSKKQISFTVLMWMIGHILVFLVYLKLSYSFIETIPQVLLVNAFHFYAHYRLSRYHASILWQYL